MVPLPLEDCVDRLKTVEGGSSLDWRIEVSVKRVNDDMWSFQISQVPQLGSSVRQEPLYVEGFLQRAGENATLVGGRIISQFLVIGSLNRNEFLMASALLIFIYLLMLQAVPGLALGVSLIALVPAFLAWRWWDYGRTRARLVMQIQRALTTGE